MWRRSFRGGPRRNFADRLRPAFRIASRLEVAQLRHLGTSGMAVLTRRSILVLETTGKRTGRRRRSPVAYLERADGELLVGGGAAGMTRVDWVANLRAEPRAAVWIGRRRIPVVAREVRGQGYERISREAFARWPGASKYEGRSGRPVPFFLLTPDGSE